MFGYLDLLNWILERPDVTWDGKSRIVFLTGSGLSSEAKLPSLRGSEGLWEGEKVESLCHEESFLVHPSKVIRFYNSRRLAFLSEKVKPTSAHRAIADLEKSLGDRVWVITQNVDNLHEQSGTRNIIHLHGNLFETVCVSCGNRFPDQHEISVPNRCSLCGAFNRLRPDIAFKREQPRIGRSMEIARSAGLFIAVGASSLRNPAGTIVSLARKHGARTFEVNLDSVKTGYRYEYHVRGTASLLLPRLIRDLCPQSEIGVRR